MSDILERIKAYKLDEIAAAKARTPLADLEARIARRPGAPRLRRGHPAQGRSEGPRADRRGEEGEPFEGTDPRGLRSAGPRPRLRGRRRRLPQRPHRRAVLPGRAELPDRSARSATSLPALRKDFLFDPYQVAEARAWGADAILIIMAAVDDALAADLEAAAEAYGLDVADRGA